MYESLNPNQFRAALHGFNREDVVAYIESLTVDHKKELSLLQESNAQLRGELQNASALLEKAKENANAKEQAQQLQLELTAAHEEIASLTAENRALQQENAALKAAKPAAAAPAAPALGAPIPPISEVLPPQPTPQRDYSEMELAAYRRAEVTERLARERAQDVYRQVRAVFANAANKFDTGKSDLDQMTKTLQMDVNQLLQLLANIRSAYNEAELSFQAVSEKNRQLSDTEL